MKDCPGGLYGSNTEMMDSQSLMSSEFKGLRNL